MFEKKKLLIALATAAFVAACGGGGGGGGDTSGGTPNPGPGTGTPDPSLAGYIQMESNNHLSFNGNFQTLAAFQDGGIYGQAKGSAGNGAPLQSFGFRIEDTVLSAGDEELEGNDSAVGRLGFSLTERAETVPTGGFAERMQIVVNGVRLSTDADNVLDAELTTGATMIVTGTSATNQAVGPIEVTIPATALRVVSDGGIGAVLEFDLEEAFSAATGDNATALQGFAPLAGRFDMNVTLSAADIYSAGATPTRLEGQPVATTGSTNPVTGSGVSGNIWIETLPPEIGG